MYNFGPYNVLLAIDTNIAVLLMTGFVLQGHIYKCSLNVPKQIVTFKKKKTLIHFNKSNVSEK